MTNDRSNPSFPALNTWHWLFAAAVALSLPFQAGGQPFQAESKAITADTVSLGFERILNTFMWNGVLGAVVGDSNNVVSLHQSLKSKLIRSNPIATQGEYDGYIGYRGRFDNDWTVLARTSSLVVSDNQSIDLSRLAQHQGYLGLGYTGGLWKLEALGGYEVDAQQDSHDQGPTFDISLENTGLQFQEIRASLQSDWTKSYLGKRTPEQRGALLSLTRDFGGGDADSLAFHYTGQRREFYTAADPGLEAIYSISHNIFRRDAVGYEISNDLFYHLFPGTFIGVHGWVQNRTIDRSYVYKNFLQPSTITLDTRIQELLMGGSATLTSRILDVVSGTVGMSFQERDERFSVIDQPGIPFVVFSSQQESAKKLEYTSQRTSLWGNVMGFLSASDTLTVDGSASILRYDTPDSMNTDDRDELLFAFTVRETHDFNRYLRVGVEANATFGHLVYLDRLQSANNNWNRVISFSPSIRIQPTDWFVSDNVGGVIANYTVYDFEEQVASVKSYSFRQASWSDSSSVKLSENIELGFSGSVRVYERGILRWKEFSEKPLDYFVEKSMWPQLIFSTPQKVSLSVGYRYFSRDQYAYDGEVRNLTHTFVTSGPTVGMGWRSIGGSSVAVTGWREASAVDSGQSAFVSNLSVSVNMVF